MQGKPTASTFSAVALEALQHPDQFFPSAPPTPRLLDRRSGDAVMQRLRSGDETALDEVVRAYWAPLVRYVRSFLQATDEAEDVAQETLVRLWEGRKSLSPDRGTLNGILYKIARNLAIDEQRHRRVRVDWRASRTAPQPSLGQRADALAIAGELQDAVDRAVKDLPARRREVFFLARFHDFTYREIAEVLGLAEQTVANHMSAALADLRQALAPFLTNGPPQRP